MIMFSGLSKRFKGVQAIRDVGGSFRPGCVNCVLGPNGCGKSTLIKAILGLVIPDGGTIEVLGRKVNERGLHKQAIGYLPQTPHFPLNLTTSELFSMVSDIREQAPIRKNEFVEIFELEGSLLRAVGVLSGGTRQKIATALALMFDSPVIILDEPSVGLDPISVIRLDAVLKKEAEKGKTVVLVTHILSEAQKLANAMMFLFEGQVRFSGSLEEMVKAASANSFDDAVLRLAQKGE